MRIPHDGPYNQPISMPVFDFNAAIVRIPGRSVVDGLRSQPGPSPDFDAILAEHHAYVAALRSANLHVTTLNPLEHFPDSIFVEDPALVFTQAAILLRPGAATRLAEANELAPALTSRFPEVLQLAEGHADGGDILVTPSVVLIGLSSRTDANGAVALQAMLDSIGLASKVVNVPSATLHLKTACSLVDEETVLVTGDIAASGLLAGFRTIVVPEEERAAANAVRINDVVLLRDDCPRTRELLESQGANVVPLPVSGISKVDAGLSCMSLRWYERASGPR
jgi:dimethylargininase